MALKKNLSLILAGVAALGLAVLGWIFWGDAVKVLAIATMDWVRTAGPVAFFGSMALLPLAGFPLSPFTLAAGPVFGPTMGAGWVIFFAITAVAINVSLSYWLAAKALRPLVVWLLARLGKALPEGPAKSSLELTLVLRVVPGTPFFVQSYLLGLARVPFWKIYLPISVVTPAIYIVVTVLAGDALGRGDHKMLFFAILLCAVVGAGLHFFRKRLQRRLREREAAVEAT